MSHTHHAHGGMPHTQSGQQVAKDLSHQHATMAPLKNSRQTLSAVSGSRQDCKPDMLLWGLRHHTHMQQRPAEHSPVSRTAVDGAEGAIARAHMGLRDLS